MTLKVDPVAVVTFNELEPADQELVEWAANASSQAYNPLLGRWAVGVAVRIQEGGVPELLATLRRMTGTRIRGDRVKRIIAGSNVEDPEQVRLCECGEGIGLAGTQAFGVGSYCEAIAIVGRREGFEYTILTPCDSCRGRIRGYARRSGVQGGFRIILAPLNYRECKVILTTLDELPPFYIGGIDCRTLEN